MELFVFLVCVGILVGIIWLFVMMFKANKALMQKSVKMGARDAIKALHVEGLGLARNVPCEIFRFDDRILIEGQPHKFEIRLDKIRAAVVKNEQELVEKGKSVVGRALIGTLLVPGLGTIVGGMSGIGTKKKKGTNSQYLIINYLDAKGELAAVTFLNNFNIFKVNNFCAALNKSIVESEPAVIQL